jgi:hypothetical protein
MQKQVVSRCLMFDGSINLLLVYYAGVAADDINLKICIKYSKHRSSFYSSTIDYCRCLAYFKSIVNFIEKNLNFILSNFLVRTL